MFMLPNCYYPQKWKVKNEIYIKLKQFIKIKNI